MSDKNPILNPDPKEHTVGDFSYAEVQLANRNSGILLEGLRYDLTPVGMHYLLSHFDVPYVEDAADWSLQFDGLIGKPLTLTMEELTALPHITRRVTLECAGNGRALHKQRWASMPWSCEAVGTAEWTGVRLRDVLQTLEPDANVQEWVFSGADEGVDGGSLHRFERSLTPEQALHPDVMLAFQMNGQPLSPQHGFPLRLIVPGWYGMASVKWLQRITAIDHAFDGYQQVKTYRYRVNEDDPGIPITELRVKSLMVPPGVPDWYSRKRLLSAGSVELVGRAWSGAGVAIKKVEVLLDGQWLEAKLEPSADCFAWSRWTMTWEAAVGQHFLKCRATDMNGNTQPLEAPWDRSGMGNNAVQSVEIWVEASLPQGS